MKGDRAHPISQFVFHPHVLAQIAEQVAPADTPGASFALVPFMKRGSSGLVRRGLLRLLASMGAVVCLFRGDAHSQGGPSLTIAVVGGASSTSRATMKGVDFGIGEARHAATLFGRNVARVDVGDCTAAGPAQVLIYAGEPDDAARVADECIQRGIVFINTIATTDSLRTWCSRFVYHVAASDAMRSAAHASSGAGGNVEMWDTTLERFGAGQLNDRYRRSGAEMRSAEWAGWMAVKVAWEAFLRVPDGTASAIAAWLPGEAAQFDGHKGAPLSFRSWDHQLRQPMYVIAEGQRPVEVPSLSRSDVPIRELLDSVGGSVGKIRCD